MKFRFALPVLILCIFAAAFPLAGEETAPESAPTGTGTSADADAGTGADAAADTAAKPSEKETSRAWSRTGGDGTMIATAERWYLEEYDRSGRPGTATLWVGGEVAERTTWIYRGDEQVPERKVVTAKTGTRETEYDGKGNERRTVSSDADGKILSTLLSNRDDSGRLAFTTLEQEGSVTRTEYEYDGDGLLLTKKISVDGALLLLCEYSGGSGENRTETVYSSGKAVLSVKYRDGVRVRDGDEKKQ